MTHTQSRTLQYIGLILIAALLAIGYWYFSVRAGVTTNSGLSQPQGGTDLSAGLALYWPLDDGSGTNADDKSTNSNDGTLTGGPSFTTGQIGGGVDFDGTDDYITLADPASGVLDFDLPYADTATGDVFTLSAWFNRDTFTTDDTIIAKKNSQSAGGSDYGYIVWIDDTTDEINVQAYGTGTVAASETSSSTTYTTTGWHHLAVVIDQYRMSQGENARQCPQIFVDGINVTDSSTCGNYLHYVNDMANALAFTVGAESDGGNPFDGKLDDVRVYTRPMVESDIQALALATTTTSGIDTGLKGYWSFDAGDTGNPSLADYGATYDRSCAGNVGVLTNGPTVTEGKSGQALAFDGSDDNVTVADTSDYTGSALTVSFWKKDTNALSNRAFVTKSTSGDRSWSIEGEDLGTGSGDGAVRFYTATGLSETSTYGTTPVVMSAGEWYHVTAVFNGAGSGNSGRMQIYINGVAQTLSFSGTIPSSLQNNSIGLRVGQGGLTSSLFLGSMDEVRAYNRALTAAEVRGLYDTGSSDKLGTSAGQAAGTGRLDSGLVGYWKYDDGSGSTAADASTNADTGTLTNGPTWTTGQIGGAVNFDGNNDYVTSAGATGADIRDSISLAHWVKFDAFPTSGNHSTFINNDTGGNHLYTFELYNNSGAYFITFVPGGGGNENTSAAVSISTGTWYHMAVSYDAQSNDVIFYLNGAVVGTADDSVVGGYAGGTGTLYFGADAGTGSYLDGQMDEVRIYDRALSSDEMAALSRLTTPTAVDTGLEGYWSMNAPDMTSTTAYDRSGAGNTGTLQDNAAGSRGVIGQAITLDGSFDRIDVGDMPTLEGQSALTISSWVRPSSLVDYAGILCKYSSTTSDTCLQAGGSGVGSSSAINAAVRNGSDAYGYTSGSKLTAGVWTHVAMVFDGSLSGNANRLKVYVDGVQEALTFSGTIPATTVSNAQNFIIGRTGGASNYWNGKLDEVRAYNRALTAAEIKAQYDAGAPDKVASSVSQPQGTGRLDSGLAGYWKLDETTGSSASDSSTNGNNGTLTNMENGDWVAGRIGNGLNFDGSNEYVDLGTAGLTNPAQLSGAAWVKPTDLAFTETYFIFSNRSGGNAGWSFGMTDPLTCSSADCAKLSFT